jgi:hypothetical protein
MKSLFACFSYLPSGGLFIASPPFTGLSTPSKPTQKPKELPHFFGGLQI